MDYDEPHLALNEKTQPIQWTKRPTSALMAAGTLQPTSALVAANSFGPSEDNLIKHIFLSMIKEGILFFITPPSSLAQVFPLNFWQVSTWGKTLNQKHCPFSYTWLSLRAPNALDLRLYPTLYCSAFSTLVVIKLFLKMLIFN